VTTVDRRRAVGAFAIDLMCIVAFVALGRRSHHEAGGVLAATARVAAPFLIGLVAGWLVARAWRDPRSVDLALIIWPVTIVVGMVLRRTAFDRSTATAFVIVATCFVGAFLVGWRALGGVLAKRRVAGT
jgi:hypothetical protein